MKNQYAKELKRKKEWERHISRQLMADAAVIAAAKVFGAGEKRCSEFHAELCQTFTEMAQLCSEDTKDMEYTKAVVDRKLAQILGDHFEPWDARYAL